MLKLQRQIINLKWTFEYERLYTFRSFIKMVLQERLAGFALSAANKYEIIADYEYRF